eukprot:TRINITY_DN8348_c0_g1::TRINITY_DN8348_c0_g1_i1::g.29096::m.29096 TRINITY_DN8348_c0_g1::TRINITY_DN8348_c0_g1_i1::g.29096  ORF type:complete len:648 (+),score=164.82,sp/Q64343/ABCG1_MOUSE/32.13/2e-94,ABC2_membrane/PF01061.19/4.5e-40,ABC_tran/PF00005.22/6.2e-26,ABC_tran/PF00005.22/3.6e+03,ABC2_membrane_3/PF12698.2/4.7e-09,AAA_21/PF13304.1/0.051,AAA_21/PF13304.1/0.00089,AAA_21/PF13304.1/3.6e+03,DUF258/PF03193.11/6.6e-05,SMC_N/PF02463.14/26,SMC_N/PF02463.14/0.15,ABC2_membrane_2/PF12679.2/2.2e+03,ABC2_
MSFMDDMAQLKSPMLSKDGDERLRVQSVRSPLRTVRLTVKNMSYSVPHPETDEPLELLHDINCDFKPGQFIALMGPSGAGKTTLLNVLRGKGNGVVDGDILLDGKEIDLRQFKILSTFVPQDDIMLRCLTPREILYFAARLRLPQSWTREQCDARVEEILEMLRLTKCADTPVGEEGGPGISGGQRKRVSIAMELLDNPAVLFVDEPTSGLDSTTAQEVCEILANLSRGGRIVICTIHQPSYECFSLFQSLLLLGRGKVVYLGPVSESLNYFEEIGYPCPKYSNPCDHFLRLVNEDVENPKGSRLPALWQESKQGVVPQHRTSRQNSHALNQEAHAEVDYATTFLYQVYVLMQRAALTTLKDKGQFRARLGATVITSLILGLAFYDLSLEQENTAERQSFIFGTLLNIGLSSTMTTVIFFPLERAVVFREHANGFYRLKSYFLSRVAVLFLFQILYSGVGGTIAYWLVGLNSDFGRYFIWCLTLILIGFVGTSLGVLIGALVPTVEFAATLVPPIMMVFLLFCGFLIREENIPPWFIAFYWLSHFHYGYETLLINEFEEGNFDFCGLNEFCEYGHGVVKKKEVLDKLEIDTKEKSRNLIVMLCMVVCLGFLTFRILKWKARASSRK